MHNSATATLRGQITPASGGQFNRYIQGQTKSEQACLYSTSLSTEPFYRNFNVLINSISSPLFKAGELILCPTVRFNLTLRAALSQSNQLVGSDWLSIFSSAEVGIYIPDTVPLFQSSTLEGCVLNSGTTTKEVGFSAEYSRADLRLDDDSNRIISYAKFTATYQTSNGLGFSGSLSHELFADRTRIKIADNNLFVDSLNPYIHSEIGAPTLGNWLKMGVSDFDIKLDCYDIGV